MILEGDESDDDNNKGDLAIMKTPAGQVPPALLRTWSQHGQLPTSS